jgi:glycosyltransferase involved in cell wall biosynthesis
MPKGSLTVTILHKLLRTSVMRHAMGRTATKIIERDRANVWFTIQTQSMWNSAVPGIPNYIYTDSTALANLYFKHFDFGRLPTPQWLEYERKTYIDAKKIFVMSSHVQRSLTEFYGIDPAKVARICVGANLRQLPAAPEPVPADNKTILFVGVDWLRKGGPELVEAFKRLPERHKDARLVIVGVSPDIKDSRIEIVGVVPLEQVANYYTRAAIFCMPTHIEPFGVVFIEAMMCGMAVTAPNQGSVVDFIKDKDTGILYAPRDIDDITRALTWLLDNPAERQAIAKRGYQAVRDIYTWDAVGRRLHEAIIASLQNAPIKAA